MKYDYNTVESGIVFFYVRIKLLGILLTLAKLI